MTRLPPAAPPGHAHTEVGRRTLPGLPPVASLLERDLLSFAGPLSRAEDRVHAQAALLVGGGK